MATAEQLFHMDMKRIRYVIKGFNINNNLTSFIFGYR